ncbi:hypothetical protein RJT34_26123 [Clitoria ternatea]|uniref:Uncharacterized protein n=1 Tax=Clitoria ternatea TaxID=43366 RepID=A0AAN9FAZ2_CLITE
MMAPTNAVGSTDDEGTEAVGQGLGKKKTAIASKKLEKGSFDSKTKKARVLVEVEREGAKERKAAIGETGF